MSAKSQDTKNSWVDPDDASEITEADIERGEWSIGGVKVTPEEGKAAFREMLGKEPKQPNPPATPTDAVSEPQMSSRPPPVPTVTNAPTRPHKAGRRHP